MAAALAAEPAWAVCPPAADADGDGFAPTAWPGCPARLDCDDADLAVNPGELEDLATSDDDNCNDRLAMFVSHADAGFAPAPWIDVGLVVRDADFLRVYTNSSSTRSLVRPLDTGVVVAVDVTSRTGTGCELRLGTAEPGASGFSWHAHPLAVDGVQMLDFSADFAPPEILKRVQVRCDAVSEVFVDWIQVQDATTEFPPPEELSVTWHDTRLPAGAHMVSVVRDDTVGAIYMADDMSGVARYDGSTWQVANGEGTTSLVMGGTLGVTDVLPLEDGSGEVFALMGDMNAGDAGGLWHTYDQGDTWEQLASAETQWGGQPWVDATNDDDVMGDPRSSNCETASGGTELIQAGGRLLQAHSASPLAGDVVYIANADPQNMGVSIWDGSDACEMPNTGDPLPADLVGALLRVDVLPNNTPVLMVGYRARLDAAASLYACTLPPMGPTCGGAAAVCEAVPLGDGAPDVRDLEHDTWLHDIMGDEWHTGVLVADAGGRPTTADPQCDYYGGSVGRVTLDDDLGYGTLTIAVEEDLVTSLDLPDVAGGVALTGISLDPDSEYLFLNTPVGPDSRYSADRAYRANADDLFMLGTTDFWAINSGEPVAVPLDEEDLYEGVRHANDLDMVGAWLEAVVNGRANVFPARHAPGAMPDFEWIVSYAFAWGEADIAAGFNGYHGWWLAFLDTPWSDNETDEATYYPLDTEAQPEGDVAMQFLPGIDVAGHWTPQGTVVREAAIGHDGHIWMAQGDLGLSHVDTTQVSTTVNPAGAEVDCLWDGWSAGANSVVAVTHSGEDGPGMTPVVWATLMDQSTSGPNHEMGVLRSLDNGTTWEYAAAGFMDAGDPEHSIVRDADDEAGSVYGFRSCKDRLPDHVAVPFPDPGPPDDAYSPAHAFSAGTTLAAARDVSTDTVGVPSRVRALDENLALVWLRPDDDGEGSYTSTGGLYLTTDGGSTWAALGFDGGAGGCDQTTVFGAGTFELRGAPADEAVAPWDGADGALELLVSVVGGGAASAECALARVVVEDLGTTPTTSWSWTSLPKLNNASWTAADCGGVHYDNLAVAAPAPWSSEVMIGGGYNRNFNGAGTVSNVWGGACLLDLNTGAARLVLDPRTKAVGVSALAPHPAVADTWVLLPSLDLGNYQECNTTWNGGAVALACEEPLPLVVRGTTGGVSTTTLDARYPHMAPATVAWSEIGVPDDSLDGVGSWLVVATSGGGTWRGELSW